MIEKMHHIQCKKGDVGSYVFLPGDPGRVEKIAGFLDNPHFVANNREYVTWTGQLNGIDVSVVSTGIGAPSAAIALEELVKLGAHTFIRIGTCGCMNAVPTPGDSIIAVSAIRRDGTSLQYLPLEFPATGHPEVILALIKAAEEEGINVHTGIIESKDSYYGQHEPENSPMRRELLEKWHMFQEADAIASEMETSILYILGSVRHVRVGSILHVYRNRIREDRDNTAPIISPDTESTIRTAIEAMRILIQKDQLK